MVGTSLSCRRCSAQLQQSLDTAPSTHHFRPFQPLMNPHSIPPCLCKCKHPYIYPTLKCSTCTPVTPSQTLFCIYSMLSFIPLLHPTLIHPKPSTHKQPSPTSRPNRPANTPGQPPGQRRTFPDTHRHTYPGPEYQHPSLLSHPHQTVGSRRVRTTPTACAHILPESQHYYKLSGCPWDK